MKLVLLLLSVLIVLELILLVLIAVPPLITHKFGANDVVSLSLLQ